MLKIVEYGIFAVSLLSILGLIISNARSRPVAPQAVSNKVADEPSESGAAPIGSAKQP